MSSNENTTMSDKLFDLCKKQLLSVINEAGNSILKITESTSLAVKDSAELFQLIEESKLNRNNEADLCLSLEASVNDILISMQFFDELSQRIEHIMEIVDLIKVESSREGFLSDPQVSKDLFNNIKSIFSIRSEFEVMRSIFPEYDEVESSKMIELF